jgi:hypothetical protein
MHLYGNLSLALVMCSGLLATTPQAPNWVLLTKRPNKAKFYVDTNTDERNGLIIFLTLQDLTGGISAEVSIALNCKAKTAATFRLTYFNKPMGRGTATVVNDSKPENGLFLPWDKIPFPDGVSFEEVANNLCSLEQKKTTNSK